MNRRIARLKSQGAAPETRELLTRRATRRALLQNPYVIVVFPIRVRDTGNWNEGPGVSERQGLDFASGWWGDQSSGGNATPQNVESGRINCTPTSRLSA
jgi:hypothetical protein